jgi:hypothetical protein
MTIGQESWCGGSGATMLVIFAVGVHDNFYSVT